MVEVPLLVVDVTARDDSRSQPVADQRHTLTLSASVTAYLWRTLQIILSVRDGSLNVRNMPALDYQLRIRWTSKTKTITLSCL